ncbi:hypothetical protein BD410DRAFT_780506 [Rickenella mellea]|uniref:Ribosomal RNA-processing protein 7 C-terminal domain-containing protein n=1 Tax=Rickenella mellea TaxID=50990 RepID=A0A4R5XFQ4_9AGAM|nr:hypothetical protein BD410DRAFT_780506 [Rickenella mellea]
MVLPDTVAGFAVFPIVYSPQVTHVIYGKSHTNPKKATKKAVNITFPDGRTLFLANVPPDATERELSLLFKSCGTVEKVVFDHDSLPGDTLELQSESESEAEDMDAAMDGDGNGEPPSKKRKRSKKGGEDVPVLKPLPSVPLRILRETGRTAHLVFLDDSSLERALALPRKPRQWPSSDEPRGLAHYAARHDALRPPLDAVREHADSAVAVYDYQEELKKQKSGYHKGEAIVDEDGFTLVTRGGAYGKTLGGGVGVANKKFNGGSEESGRRRKKKKEGKEKDGFYAFQNHEKKRNELLQLKKNWEEDKAKVEKLRESRRFKPY